MEILVTRQPVFDRWEQLYGYDLALQQAGQTEGASDAAPEQLVADAFLGIGLNQVAAGHRALVTVDRDMLIGGAVRLLPTDRVTLQIAGPTEPDPELLQACGELASGGYRFSIVTDHPEQMPEDLLHLADIVKIDVRAVDRATLSDLVVWLRGFKVRLLATQVRHRIERDLCTNLGFELFEGYRFAAPETLTRRDLPIEHVHTFRLLKMVRDPNAADAEIEDVLRRDVALSYKLLRMVNSAAVGGRDIWSIGHALRLLGREQVARWLGLLLVTDGMHAGVRAELMTLALVRARMCELLAQASNVPRAGGSLFLVGMLSVLDQLLETPMAVLADSMDLAPDIRLALLKREEYHGTVLSLVEAYEQGKWDRVDGLAGSLGVSTVSLSPLYLKALEWSTEHQPPADDPSQPPGRLSDRAEARGGAAYSSSATRFR